MKKRKGLSWMLAIALTCSALTGCGEAPATASSSETSEDTVVASGELGSVETKGSTTTSDEMATEIHIALNTQPPSLDATMTTAAITSYVATHIFEKLVSLKSDYTVDLELAESYEHNEDYTEQTYKLRKGVLFHNGDELKAEDVVASMNRWIDNYGQAKNMLGDARFEQVDDYTVKIVTETPCMYLNELIGYLGNGFISPKEVIDATPAGETLSEYIGTGPYKFTEWVTDQYIRLDKFEDYVPYAEESDGWWGKKEANIQTLFYEIVTDDSTRVAGMMNGDYDVAMNMPQDNYDMLANNPDIKTYKALWASPILVFNKAEGVSTDVNLRKAIQAALDMDEIMMAGYSSEEFYNLSSCDMYPQQANWYTTVGSEYYNQNNPELAKEYLAQSDYNGETFKILCTTDYSDLMAIAVVIENQLENIGINVEIESYDWATFLTYRSDPTTFDAYVSTYVPVMVPSMTLYMGAEYAGWYRDEYAQKCLADISASTDIASAFKIWEELEEYNLSTAVPYCKLGESYTYSVSTSKLDKMGVFQAPTFFNAVLYK